MSDLKQLKEKLMSQMEGSDIRTIQQIVKKNYWKLRRLESGDINEIFNFIKDQIKESKDRKDKLYILSTFSEKCKNARLMLRLEFEPMFAEAGDIQTIKQIVNQNSSELRGLGHEDINVIFKKIKAKIQQSENLESKTDVLTFFSSKKNRDAKLMLKDEIITKLESVKDNEALNKIIRKNSSYLSSDLKPEEIYDFFKIVKEKIESLEDRESKPLVTFNTLEFFTYRKIDGAKQMLRQEIKNQFINGDASTIRSILRNRWVNRLTKADLLEVFEQIDLEPLQTPKELELLMQVLYIFSKSGSKDAKTLLHEEVKENAPNLSERVLKSWIKNKYFSSIKKEDVKTIYNKIDFDKILKRDFQMGTFLLSKFEKMGCQNADEIIKTQALDVFKNITVNNLSAVTNKTFEKYVSKEDLDDFIRANDALIINNLLCLFNEPLSSTHKSKIHGLLKKVKEVSESEVLLRKNIVTIFESATEQSISNLIKAKLFTYLNEEDKTALLSDPNCLLSRYYVIHKGSEFLVDHYLKLNLSNQNIKAMTDIVGLSGLGHLKTLDISGNQISQINGLGNLTSLKKLKISGNPISEDLIIHLGGVDSKGFAKEPQKFVEFSRLEASGDIESVIVNGKKYEVLENRLVLSDLQIKALDEIEGLASLTNLIELDLSLNQLSDLAGIENLTSLKTLKLQHNKIVDTSVIEKLTNLEELRLFGNHIYELKGIQDLENLKILDLDSKRKISENKYLKYLLNSLETSELKNICTNYNIQNFSKLERNSLINLIRTSLSDEEERDVINKIDEMFISKAIKKAVTTLEDKDRDLNSIKIVDARTNEIEFRFRGRPHFYISITPDNIDNPDRDCNCSIGASMGFCDHFWVGVIYSLKKGYFDASDWTLTPLPDNLMDNLAQLKL